MKHKRHLITLFFGLMFSLVFFTNSSAQVQISCNTQACIDYYGSLGDTIVSAIMINGGNLDLTPLSGITAVTGDLMITQTQMTNLHGSENITSVGGIIEIYNNTALTNIDALQNITSLGGDLYVGYNPVLSNLNGLQGITSLNYNLAIVSNDVLTNLSGLQNITWVGGGVEISTNNAMTNLTGLTGLTSIGSFLVISQNDALTSLIGLEKLTSIGNDLRINNNHILTNLDGLNSLSLITGEVNIQHSKSLKNLDGLQNLTTLGGALKLMFCDSLTNLDGLRNLSSVGGDVYIQMNPLLTGFCGLYRLLSEGTYNYIYIYSNGVLFPYPPGPIEPIIAGGPCASDAAVVNVDIKPESCPNAFNVSKKGDISAAILGTDDLDVQNIDPSTLLLEGVSPTRWSFKDVTAPYIGGEPCGCTTAGPDGYKDLNLKFDGLELAAALGEVNDGDELELTLTGSMTDGTSFEGSDCVIILSKNPKKDIDGNSGNMPVENSLFGNYPNPFNPSTKIKYSVAQASNVVIKIYDVLGNEIETLVNADKQAGTYELTWQAKNIPSGIYFYQMNAGSYTSIQKMILLK